jgi:hypothetical protein
MMKLGPLRRKHRLLVVDIPSIDVVLGLDFMTKYNMVLSCKERSLTFPTPAGSNCLRALSHHDDITVCSSATI